MGKHIWKAFKPIWTCIGFSSTLLAQSLWKSLRSWTVVPGGWWSSRYFHMETVRQLEPWKTHPAASPSSSHTSGQSRPQESIVWVGAAGRGRQRSSDSRKSNKVNTNSRVAGGRGWAGKRGQSDNPALCCQRLNQAVLLPFQPVGKGDYDWAWFPTSFSSDQTSTNVKQLRDDIVGKTSCWVQMERAW